jgi:hypothetical protein
MSGWSRTVGAAFMRSQRAGRVGPAGRAPITSSDPDYPHRWSRRPGALDDVGFRVGNDNGVGPTQALSPDVYLDDMGAANCRPAWSSAYGWTIAMRNARAYAWRRRPRCPCTRMILARHVLHQLT